MIIRVGEKYKIFENDRVRNVEVTKLERSSPTVVMVHYKWSNIAFGLRYTETDTMGFSSFVDNIKATNGLPQGELTELDTEDYYITQNRRY